MTGRGLHACREAGVASGSRRGGPSGPHATQSVSSRLIRDSDRLARSAGTMGLGMDEQKLLERITIDPRIFE
jgi:hypothetical protein